MGWSFDVFGGIAMFQFLLYQVGDAASMQDPLALFRIFTSEMTANRFLCSSCPGVSEKIAVMLGAKNCRNYHECVGG